MATALDSNEEWIPSQRVLGEKLRKFMRPSGSEINPDMLAKGFKPRDPQVDVLDAASQALLENRGSGLFVRPPRTGKTILFGATVKALDQRTAILVPSKDLVDQTYEKLRDVVGIDPDRMGRLHSEIPNDDDREEAKEKQILITTYNTFRNMVANDQVDPYDRPFLVCDEVHRANGEATRPIIKYFMDQGALVHGWTATDMFADGTTVSETLFQGDPPIHELSFHEAALAGEIAPTRNIVLETDLMPKIETSEFAGEFSERDVRTIIKQNGRDEAAVAKVLNTVDIVKDKDGTIIAENEFCNLPQIWYCAGVEHAKKVADDLNAAYQQMKTQPGMIRILNEGSAPDKKFAVAISGTTPQEDRFDAKGNLIELGRKSIFKAYEEGNIRCLVCADLLVEGYDFPHCEMTVMLRPTKSPRVAVQAGARSTGLNPKDPKKIAYALSLVDQGVEGVAIFGPCVGGEWLAPDHMSEYTFETTSKERVKPNRTDLPSIKTAYHERERINFNERRKGVKVLQSKIPEGFAEASAFLRRQDYRRFVDFDGKLERAFQEFERQYLEAQDLLSEDQRYKDPFMTKQGVTVAMATNVTGGHSLIVNKREMEHYVENEIMPEPLLEYPLPGYVYLRDALKGFYQSQSDYVRIEQFEQSIARQYQNEQKTHTLMHRHKEPFMTEQGISVLKARSGRRNVMTFKEEDVLKYIEDQLHLTPKAPPQQKGFLTLKSLKRTLHSDRYVVKDVKIKSWFDRLERQYMGHLHGKGLNIRDADVWTNEHGIAMTIAHTKEGNQLVVANNMVNIEGNVNAVESAIRDLHLYRRLPLLPALDEKRAKSYIPIDNMIQWAISHYGAQYAAPLAEKRERLEEMYDRHLGLHPPEEGHCKAVKSKAGIRVIKARKDSKTNGFFIHRADVDLVLAELGIEHKPAAVMQHGFTSYNDAVDEMRRLRLNDSGIHTFLQFLQMEYDEAQTKLPAKERHKEPVMTSFGIRVMQARVNNVTTYVFDQEQLMAEAPKQLTRDADAPAVKTKATPSLPPRSGDPEKTVTSVTSLKRHLVALSHVPDLDVSYGENKDRGKGTISVKALGSSLKGYPRSLTFDLDHPRKAREWSQTILDEASKRHHMKFEV